MEPTIFSVSFKDVTSINRNRENGDAINLNWSVKCFNRTEVLHHIGTSCNKLYCLRMQYG